MNIVESQKYISTPRVLCINSNLDLSEDRMKHSSCRENEVDSVSTETEAARIVSDRIARWMDKKRGAAHGPRIWQKPLIVGRFTRPTAESRTKGELIRQIYCPAAWIPARNRPVALAGPRKDAHPNHCQETFDTETRERFPKPTTAAGQPVIYCNYNIGRCQLFEEEWPTVCNQLTTMPNVEEATASSVTPRRLMIRGIGLALREEEAGRSDVFFPAFHLLCLSSTICSLRNMNRPCCLCCRSFRHFSVRIFGHLFSSFLFL